MKDLIKRIPIMALPVGLSLLLGSTAAAVNLLETYPTKLATGLLEPAQARAWQFNQNDIFRVSSFQLEVAGKLKVETGPADLGIGHCTDGAVFAVLVPTEKGTLTRGGGGTPEAIAHIWLRFHPGEINRLFPPDTVSGGTNGGAALAKMHAIAGTKFRASYHAGMNAMIPEPKDMTVDVDTKSGVRRFFMVDTRAGKAEYVAAFEKQPVRFGGTGSGPKIVSTQPVNGATGVDPGLAEITVTFDQDMDAGFSWTGGGPEYPTSPQGAKAQWRDKRTCVLPVALQSGRHYRVGINSPSYRNFRSTAGQSVAPSSISFTTR
jgi:Bacterial Ig-like domain